ncbi:DUF4136 domain-containing protein [Pseudomonas sp. CR3202]|uniref:DUF4136 domain-containing protein n=1 Tax=Pseudomonas sp. CR3202 TaxID=3351532 RepID=UPI003BF37258
MIRRTLLLSTALLLAACQNYDVNRDYDSTRDFAAYRSWSWKEPALQYRPDDPRIKSDLTERRIREAVSQQLDQRGLREAASGKADLNVQSWLIVDERQQQTSYNYGGGYWNGYWGGYMGGPPYTETRTYNYKVATIQVDMYDGKDGKLVWRGSAEQVLASAPPSPADREASIRETVTKVIQQYPPR